MSELDDLRAARGRWCFPDGKRCLRVDRIKELEAIKPKAKAKAKKKKGKTDAKSQARATEET